MSDPSAGRGRRSMLSAVPLALVPALLVAGFYEMRERHQALDGKRGAASRGAEAEVASSSPPNLRGAEQVTCTELRSRYLARCSGEPQPTSPAIDARPAPSGDAPIDGGEAAAIAEADAWLAPSPSELAAMAGRCEVRFLIPALSEDEPPTVGDTEAAALSLSDRERALLEQTLRALHAEVRSFAERGYAEGASQPGRGSTPTLEEMLSELQSRPENGYAEGRRKLARELAGLAPPPADAAQEPPGERLIRFWSGLGDEMERRLANGLGAERARQLRFSPHASWMNRFSESGCATDL